jgi:hypothetical protein
LIWHPLPVAVAVAAAVAVAVALLLLLLMFLNHRAARPAAPQQIPELPEAVVVCILQHVQLRQRLTSCALVCRAWAAVAATTAPADIELRLDSTRRTVGLEDWLSNHGGVVVGLDTRGFR